jgi:fibronectin-binding autotransporter adhesin
VEMSATLGVDGSTTLRSDLAVLKDAGIGGGLEVDGATGLHNALSVDGNVIMAKSVAIGGESSFRGAVEMAGTLVVTGATTLSSTLGVAGDVTVGTSQFTVDASSGNTDIAGTLAVTGITTLAEDLRLSEDAAALTHTGTTGLAITSTSGYVDVEDVRITGAAIGVSGDTDLVSLSKAQVTVAGSVTIEDRLDVGGESSFYGAVEMSATLGVDGDTRLRSDLAVLKDASIGGDLDVEGATALHNTAVAGTLEVTGITTLAALSVGVTTLTGEI